MLGLSINNISHGTQQQTISLNSSVKNHTNWLFQQQLQQRRNISNRRRQHSSFIQNQPSLFKFKKCCPPVNSSLSSDSFSFTLTNVKNSIQKTTNEWFNMFSSGIMLDALLRRNSSGISDLGFGFSAGGLLFPYLIGVATQLQKEGLITRNTKLAGASAGSLIAACIHAGLSEQDMMKACLQIANDCRKYGTVGRLKKSLKSVMFDMIPDDAHEKCSNKTFVAITQVYPFRGSGDYLISNFSSSEDLIHALLTSCHVPWWFDNTFITDFRDTKCVDGGLTNLMPVPPSVKKPIRVSCFPIRGWGEDYGAKIAPDIFRDKTYSMNQYLSWALSPADDKMLFELKDMGKDDAKSFAKEFNSGKYDVNEEEESNVLKFKPNINVTMNESNIADKIAVKLDMKVWSRMSYMLTALKEQ